MAADSAGKDDEGIVRRGKKGPAYARISLVNHLRFQFLHSDTRKKILCGIPHRTNLRWTKYSAQSQTFGNFVRCDTFLQ